MTKGETAQGAPRGALKNSISGTEPNAVDEQRATLSQEPPAKKGDRFTEKKALNLRR